MHWSMHAPDLESTETGYTRKSMMKRPLPPSIIEFSTPTASPPAFRQRPLF